MLFVSYLHTEYCGSAEYAEKGLSKSFPRPVPGNPGRSITFQVFSEKMERVPSHYVLVILSDSGTVII